MIIQFDAEQYRSLSKGIKSLRVRGGTSKNSRIRKKKIKKLISKILKEMTLDDVRRYAHEIQSSQSQNTSAE